MKKSSKSSLKKRSLDISLQHKNEASYKFSKKKFCNWPKKGLGVKGLSTSSVGHPWLAITIYRFCLVGGFA